MYYILASGSSMCCTARGLGYIDRLSLVGQNVAVLDTKSMTTGRPLTTQEKTLQGASVAEVVRAYDEGLISVARVRLLLGISDRHARRTLRESGVHIRTRAEEVYARCSRGSADNGSSPQAAPAADVIEPLYKDHLAGR